MDQYKNIRGIIGTVIFHGLLLAVFLLVSLAAPFPPPPEEGIVVDFGTNQQGFGRDNPSVQQYTTPIVEEQKQEESTPVVHDTKVLDIPEKSKTEAQDLITQKVEEAPEINVQKNREEEAERKRLDEIERLRKAELERKRKVEIEKQRIEEERLRQEEIERQRIADEERKRKEAEQKKRDDISNRMKKSFGGEGNTGKNTSEGVREGIGNQGVKTGAVDSGDRTMIHSSGNGISYSLEGRSVVGTLKRPQYPGQNSGKVVVSITVNKEGRVVSAIAGVRGSTTMDSKLLEAARKASLTARFNKLSDPAAPISQKGTITYIFKITGG